jgi:hypothetical protein
MASRHRTTGEGRSEIKVRAIQIQIHPNPLQSIPLANAQTWPSPNISNGSFVPVPTVEGGGSSNCSLLASAQVPWSPAPPCPWLRCRRNHFHRRPLAALALGDCCGCCRCDSCSWFCCSAAAAGGGEEGGGVGWCGG